MSQTFHNARKRPRSGDKGSGKCGEITYCMQVGIRVYALKCLFCPQICIQWDDFINHIEDTHDEGLRSGELLQSQRLDIGIKANCSKEPTSKSFSTEATQLHRTGMWNELDKNTSAGDGGSCIKTESCDGFEISVINEANIEQTCDSIDEQKPFESIHSLSDSDSELEVLTPHSNHNYQNDRIMSMGQIRYVDYSRQHLPTAQEIRLIPELQTIFSVKVLENKHRTKLAKGLISYILNSQPERKIHKHEFFQLAQSIVDIFPLEVIETYYVPHRTGYRAKGKLFDAYNNTRTRFSNAGIINRRLKSKPEENNAIETECEAEPIVDSELSILQSCDSDWDLVLRTWRKTHCYRQRELKTQALKVEEYIEKYKVLLHDKCYELFVMDFKMIYPNAKTIYNWKLYYPKIIAKAEKLRESIVREILYYINDTEDEDSKLALSFVLITYVLPNRQKTSKAEIQESFISYSKSISEAFVEPKQRSERLKLDEQPKVFLIGDSSKILSLGIVEICGKRLTFKNPLKAIEVCFYCFMVMNIKYPKYIAHVWMFIKKLIYEIDTPDDFIIPAINTVINDLRLDKFQ